MVGHYWLRDPRRAPSPELMKAIEDATTAVKSFAKGIHQAGKFKRFLSIGIGGSALGPMFVADALGDPSSDQMEPHFIDNTDPDGMDRILRSLSGKLGETLVVVTSKSGSTPEPRNGMLAAAAAYRAAGLDFGRLGQGFIIGIQTREALAAAGGCAGNGGRGCGLPHEAEALGGPAAHAR